MWVMVTAQPYSPPGSVGPPSLAPSRETKLGRIIGHVGLSCNAPSEIKPRIWWARLCLGPDLECPRDLSGIPQFVAGNKKAPSSPDVRDGSGSLPPACRFRQQAPALSIPRDGKTVDRIIGTRPKLSTDPYFGGASTLPRSSAQKR
jgi:hypothetical protein